MVNIRATRCNSILFLCQLFRQCLNMDANLTSIIQVALQQGIWAALYIYLFFRMLKENAEREAKYQSMIDTLSGSILKGIDDIQDRLDIMSQTQIAQNNIPGG